MNETKIRDIEEFIATIEERIVSLGEGIEVLGRYGIRSGDTRFAKAILIREKKEMEDELLRFRNMNASELINTGFSGFDRLTSYKEIIIE